MALTKEALWKIVTGEETAPVGDERERVKFATRRIRALATVVLSFDPSILFSLWKSRGSSHHVEKVSRSIREKTWATRFDLCRKLHSMRLKGGDSTQEHIKTMTELFDSLLVTGETVLEVVTERILHQERKSKDRNKASSSTERAMTSHRSFKRKLRRGTYCGRLGHIKKFCRELKADQREKKEKPKAASTTSRKD